MTTTACATFVALCVAGFARGGPIVRDKPNTIEATFAARSYFPGTLATLRIAKGPSRITVQLFRVEATGRRSQRADVLAGKPVDPPRHVHARTVRLRMPADTSAAPSGLYFARLSATGGRLGYATVILRAAPVDRPRVAVVLPTNTWQAYNFRDLNGDGIGDTWYASPLIHVVDMSRPFLDRGVPPHFRGYDRGFLDWLGKEGYQADVLSDDDLERFRSVGQLARRYDLIVFSGHEEYVTSRVFDLVHAYRDLGGNLIFLSANNLFYRVERRGHDLIGRWRFRDSGRPEAAVIGEEYLDWNHNRYRNAPYVVTGAERAPWLFEGTNLRDGSVIPGSYGIEIDCRTHDSPRGTVELARVPNVFGPGRSAEMTYYQTASGAKVFAAGTIDFGGFAESPVVSKLLENLWEHLSRP